MDKYTCKTCGCGRKFGDNERELTNDENKCILHCEKKDNIEYTPMFQEIFNANLDSSITKKLKIKYIHFPKNFDNKILQKYKKKVFEECKFHGTWQHLSSQVYDDLNTTEYDDCQFDSYISNNPFVHNKVKISNLVFINCKFNSIHCKGAIFEKRLFWFGPQNKYYQIKKMKFEHCEFKEDFMIISQNDDNKRFFINEINLEHSIFNKKVKIQFCDIQDANFYNTSFTDLADFYQTKFEEVNFERTDFEKMSIFTEVIFSSDVNFKYTTFEGKTLFNKTIFQDGINLEESFIHSEMNFLNSKINDVTTRETARIIKHSFDTINNIIEANKFYELEMKKREEELNNKGNNNWFERLIFNIHGITSNHSQDALLVLFWIINIGFMASLFDYLTQIDVCGNFIVFSISYFLGSIGVILGIIGIRNIVKDIFRKTASFFMMASLYTLYTYTSKDFGLTDFANVINPFSIMTKGESLNLGMLIFKVIIAYLMYQFVVSIRQNTRRK